MSAPSTALLAPSGEDAVAIAAHDAIVRRMEELAGRFAAAGNAEDAAACVKFGSWIAWMNHSGRFANARFEDVLREGAAGLPRFDYGSVADEPRRILHVLSEGYDTGGHTRLAWRWMLSDRNRVHALAQTRHWPVPKPMLDALAERGGEPLYMPGPHATLLERAAQLRAVASNYDLLLLHVHPDDPIPSLAFAGQPGRPPTVFVNHADHCYWLGREVADLVVSHRSIGSRITRERRGIPEARTTILPLPLVGAALTGDREAARRELGIAPDQVVLLTIGADYKFGPVSGPHFLDAAEPVVARHREAVLIAAGPDPTERFLEASERTGGRVRALGRLESVTNLYAAADIYLESYPCSSGTAVREAAAHGTPVLTFAPDPVEAEMVGSDVSLADVWQRATTVEDYVELASELIADPAARARWGEAARESVAEAHEEERWRAMLDDVYRRAIELGPVSPDELEQPSEELSRFDTIVHRIHARTGKQVPLARAGAETDRLELIGRSPVVRRVYGSLVGASVGLPEQRLKFPMALAAPPADATVVNALVDEFRRLRAAAVAGGLAIVAAPDTVDALVPLIEAALAAGPDVDVDLVVHDRALDANAPGTLLVRTSGDAFGDLPADEFPLQHAAA